jgi:FG-GAP repeat
VARLIVPGADQCVGGLTVSQFLLEASPEEREAADACAKENRVDSGAFGHRVEIDGDTVVVTAPFADGEDGSYSVGKAHVYRRDPGGADLWPYVATLSPSMPSSGGYFGSALALAGDTVLIGAPGTTIAPGRVRAPPTCSSARPAAPTPGARSRGWSPTTV